MRPKSALRNRAEWLATREAWDEERGIQLAALQVELASRIEEKSQKTLNRLEGLGDHAAITAIAHAMPDSVMKFYALQSASKAKEKTKGKAARGGDAAGGDKP